MLAVPRFSLSQNKNTILKHGESRQVLNKIAFEHSRLEVFKSLESLTGGSLTTPPTNIFFQFKLISIVYKLRVLML